MHIKNLHGSDARTGLHGKGHPSAPSERARQIASLFDLPEPIEAYEFPQRGNINRETFLIIAGPRGERGEYLLQLLNPEVFSRPRAVMDAMNSCIQAQQKALSECVLREDEEWEPVRLITTKEGGNYLEISDQGGCKCWRMMRKISHARSYKNLREIPDPPGRLKVAEQAGRGLALFGILTASMDPSAMACPLPGYRDTHRYYDQLASVLAGSRTLQDAAAFLPAEPVLRRSTQEHFLVHIQPEEYRRRLGDPQLQPLIARALEQKSFAVTLQEELRSGDLKKAVVHGDTKLDNFLFSTLTGKLKGLVDLDTVMPHTWLTDWGDLARSLANAAGEIEPDPHRIEVDLEVFEALARGFIRRAPPLQRQEMNLMVEAAQIMALELGIRFLADYLRGDSYFKLSPGEPPDLNKIRAIVQFTLFERLRARADSAKRCIAEACKE